MRRAVAASARWLARTIAALVAVAVAGVAALAGAATAHAHAELLTVNPADGSMLNALPAAVELTFSEPVGRPADIVVLGPDGAALPTGDVVTLDAVASVTIDPGASASPGWYTISYQVTSADGHLVSGTTSFMLHASGDTSMGAGAPVAGGAVSAGDPTDADPIVVAALVLALAAGLTVALAAVRRLLVAEEMRPV